MFVCFRAKIGKIDVAIFQTCNRHNLESRHDRAGRIGAVRRCRNETNVAMRFAARRVIFANRQQTCEFALRSGIRLQRNRREAGDFRKPVFQLLENLQIACRLFDRARTDAISKFPAMRSETFPRSR